MRRISTPLLIAATLIAGSAWAQPAELPGAAPKASSSAQPAAKAPRKAASAPKTTTRKARAAASAAAAEKSAAASPASAPATPDLAPAGDVPDAPAASGSRLAAEAKARRQFDLLDSNGDGMLTKDEVRFFPRLRDAFAAADGNHDGRVSFDEIRAFTIRYRAERGKSTQ